MTRHGDPLETLVVPDGTEAQERDLVTEGDVLVGGRATIEFGIRGGTVVAGEGVRFGGGIEAEGDCRLDMWCDVAESVLVGGDAYLGERVHIGGELKVAGDLDIGDDVDIEEGFEANGWIVIRNPMPTIVLLFVYLKHLLVVGDEEAAQRFIDELVDDESSDEPSVDPLVVPAGATVSDDAWRVSTPATIGDDCRLHGNIRATSMTVGENTEIFGSLRAQDDIEIAAGTTVHGDVTTSEGTITLGDDVRVLGDLSCGALELGTEAAVDGTMRAAGRITMQTDPGRME
ncbi:polymer-forming cytoskeletal protein [Halovivax limisalsi]|uniref:polymer-forming cytoskeletal protein n=1 Tax=Halovivax limisalsi TaxID=1453760 RepID=UPI001FFCC7B8|nr:polymer-forming cytoskeletal protein [Halovivax limisalsi]